MHTISIAEAEAKTDKERLAFIKEQWGISKGNLIEVIGELSVKNNHHRIWSVKSVENSLILRYPISDLDELENIPVVGVFVPPAIAETIKKKLEENPAVLIQCELILASKWERDKRKNPLLLQALPSSVRTVDRIQAAKTISDENGDITESTLSNYFEERHKEQIADDQRKLKESHESEISTLTNKAEDLEKRFTEQNIKYIDIVSKVQAKKNSLKTIALKALDKNKELGMLRREKTDLIKQIKLNREADMEKLQKFRSFLKTKADSMMSLEFINEEQYNEILDIHSDTDLEKTNYIDFKQDLNADFSSAISHIQAHLFHSDINYPKYVLEDYFSLIQTNDLIILAGDSGSGKTNLVKSFADAVGGVAEIIPVKPSWTSSEDLLGYYNPLQKTYLSTPFLTALIKASQNPEIPYFICLDEMNLARVEYYFADFLSALEERNELPNIVLYSDDESDHVLSEFNNVIQAIEALQEKHKKNNVSNFYDILKDDAINHELKAILGLSDKVSLISYHSTLRRMIGGILKSPPSIQFPSNVRIIGTINIDETTHYLSPKVLDRAQVIKFDNPLLADWGAIQEEVRSSGIEKPDHKLRIGIDYFGERKPYPRFSHDNEFCRNIVNLTKDFFKPLGVEIGFRTVRQGMSYKESFGQFNESESIAFNNFILHKVLPKFTFDGTTKIGSQNKIEIVEGFKEELKNIITEEVNERSGRNAITELTEMIKKSKENDGILNYWA